MRDQLTTAWRTNQTINEILIEAIAEQRGEAGFAATLSKRGGRGVAGEFAHMHNVRRMQIEKRAKDLLPGLLKFETKAVPVAVELVDALRASAAGVEQLLVGALEGQPKRRGFRKGIFATLAYFVSHEAHHRGRIVLTLKAAGIALDKDTLMRIWGWDQL